MSRNHSGKRGGERKIVCDDEKDDGAFYAPPSPPIFFLSSSEKMMMTTPLVLCVSIIPTTRGVSPSQGGKNTLEGSGVKTREREKQNYFLFLSFFLSFFLLHNTRVYKTHNKQQQSFRSFDFEKRTRGLH